MDIWKEIDAVEHLAKASKLQRFLSTPLRYLKAQSIRHIFYPIQKKAKLSKCKTFFGDDISVLLPAGTDIFLFGAKTHDSEIRLAKFMIKNLNKGDAFLDIGAHYGYFTLLASFLVGERGKILAIEASGSTYQRLLENVKDKSNVRALNNACADENKKMIFYEFPVMYSEYSSLNIDQYEKEAWLKKYQAKEIKIDAVKVDDLLLQEKISPKIIKVDVEGAEDQVVQGMELTLKDRKSMLIVIEYLVQKNQSHRLAAKMLHREGFYANFIQDDGSLEKVELENIEKELHKRGLDSENVVFKS